MSSHSFAVVHLSPTLHSVYSITIRSRITQLIAVNMYICYYRNLFQYTHIIGYKNVALDSLNLAHWIYLLPIIKKTLYCLTVPVLTRAKPLSLLTLFYQFCLFGFVVTIFAMIFIFLTCTIDQCHRPKLIT